MPLTLQLVTRQEVQVLDNLLQLYLHETSKFSPVEIQEDGKFSTSQIISKIDGPEIDAYLIRIKGKLAGIAIVQPKYQAGQVIARSLTDLFILESYRGFGIGEEVARMVFDESPGLWHLEISPQHEEAAKFWAKVIYRYTGDDYRHLNRRKNHTEIFEFRSPAARPQVGTSEPTVVSNVVAKPQES